MKKTFKIRRQDREDTAPYWDFFEVSVQEQMTVLDALKVIRERPINQQGQAVAPVVWECGCADGHCGVCLVTINSRARLVCSTLLDDLDEPVILEPLTKFKVLRDLIVDREIMYGKLVHAQVWQRLDSFDWGGMLSATPSRLDAVCHDLAKCFYCGACLEACPHFGEAADFLGAVTVTQTWRHKQVRPHHVAKSARDDVLLSKGGVASCHNVQNCEQVCPQKLPLTQSLGLAKRSAIKAVVRKYL